MPEYDSAILLLLVMSNLFFKPPLAYLLIPFIAYAVVRQLFVPIVVKKSTSNSQSEPK